MSANSSKSPRFEHIRIRAVRNLRECELSPAPRLNVISGENGQGKTSVLEALYLVSTTRSFRSERISETIQEGEEVASVVARVVEDSSSGPVGREQRLGLAKGRRSMLIDGTRVQRAADFAVKTPIVVFHPKSLDLVSGAASGRRALLDRLIVYLYPAVNDDRQRYLLALRERQRTLADHGPHSPAIHAYEALMAKHGVKFAEARRLVAERLSGALVHAFEAMASTPLELSISYQAGGTEDEKAFLEELSRRRPADLRRGSATFGPQKDELDVSLDGRSARRHASQGQQRIITLALKAAEIECVRDARRAYPVILLDDISSELDAERTDSTLAFLTGIPSQVFLTTTRAELFEDVVERHPDAGCWSIHEGCLRPA